MTPIHTNKKTPRESRGAYNSSAGSSFQLSHLLLQVCIDGIQKFFRIQVMLTMLYLITVHAYCKVLGHLAALDRLDADGFQRIGKPDQRLIAIQLPAEGQAPGPRKDRGDRVG